MSLGQVLAAILRVSILIHGTVALVYGFQGTFSEGDVGMMPR